MVIMGRKTFESIGRPLPQRINIVVTRNEDFKAEGVTVFNSFLDAVEFALKNKEMINFIIGGGEIYRLGMAVTERIYLTEVDVVIPDAQVFFPEMPEDEWKLISEEIHLKDEQNPYNCNFKVFERTKPVTVLGER